MTAFSMQFNVSGNLNGTTIWRPPAVFPTTVLGPTVFALANLGVIAFNNPFTGSPLSYRSNLMISMAWMSFSNNPAFAFARVRHPAIEIGRDILAVSGASAQTEIVMPSLLCPKGFDLQVLAQLTEGGAFVAGPHVLYLTIQIVSSTPEGLLAASLVPKTPSQAIPP